MAKLHNDLFIGSEHLNIEGPSIKHPALIKEYGQLSSNKVRETPIQVVGMDLETNHRTGEPRLLGFYQLSPKGGPVYSPYFDKTEFLDVLFKYIRYCKSADKALVWWNKLDAYVIFRILALATDNPDEQYRAMTHFSKIGGEWNKDSGSWDIEPVLKIEAEGLEFGIKNVIRSSIQFYYRYTDDIENDRNINTVWGYDVAQLYQFGLAKEAEGRLDYYSKVHESAHIVDWDRFNSDDTYRNDIVLKSNELDARAVHDLAMHIQKDFYNTFNFYPMSLISQGSFARSALFAMFWKRLKPKYPDDDKKLFRAVKKELQSISLINYQDEWVDKYGQEAYKDFQALLTECYSGGQIEAIMYGYTKSGWTADIASAYPAVIEKLYDLRGAKIKRGKGVPEDVPYSYTFMRGTINIPKEVKYHSLTIKHWENKGTNIRPTGIFKGSYTLNERKYLISKGATFKDEEYYQVITKGKLSPMAYVTTELIDMRKRMEAELKGSGFMPKIVANSLYGILFEAVDTYEMATVSKEIIINEDRDTYYKDILRPYRHRLDLSGFPRDYVSFKSGWHKTGGMPVDVASEELKSMGVSIKSDNPHDIIEEIDTLYRQSYIKRETKTVEEEVVQKAGYRAGEFWNPLYATIITSETRLLMSKASDAIDKAGGKVILLMTDSILWEGTSDMLPAKYWKEPKTLGYFEKPERVHDIVCLGSGRYGYTVKGKNKEYRVMKKRGLNVTDIHDSEGEPLDDFDWANALEIMKRENSNQIKVSVRTLVSVGMVLHNSAYTINDLGRVVEDSKEVDAIVGRSKRYYTDAIKDPQILATQLVPTEPIHISPSMFGKFELMDQTLPVLRREMMKNVVRTRKDKRRQYNRNTQKRYYEKNKEILRDRYHAVYKYLSNLPLDLGGTEKSKMANWSKSRLELFLDEKGLDKREISKIFT
jgi:hypothetical protein